MPRIIESEEVKITTSDKGHDIYDEYLDDIIDETSIKERQARSPYRP